MELARTSRPAKPMLIRQTSLPETLCDLAQSDGSTYIEPSPITFPNIDDLVPETEVDIWSVDPDLGEFVVVGTGRVTTDGQFIETIAGGIRANDWHFISPGEPIPDPSGAEKPNPILVHPARKKAALPNSV